MTMSLMIGLSTCMAQPANAASDDLPGTDVAGTVDLSTPTTSLRFPTANNKDAAVTEQQQALRQPADTGWFPMWNAPGALFALVRVDRTKLYDNQSYAIIGQITDDGSRFSSLRLYGANDGTSTRRLHVNGRIHARNSTSGAAIPGDAFLAVLRRTAGGTCVTDLYGLDGTKIAGVSGGTISQSQTVPADPTGYGIYVGSFASSTDKDGEPTPGAGTEWPGEIAAVGYVVGDVPDATWQAIAQGAALETELAGFTVPWVRELDGTAASLAAPAWATDDATAPMTVWGHPTLEPGTDFVKAAPDDYLLIDSKGDGYVHGIMAGQTSRSVTFSGTAAGRTGTVEVRGVYLNGDVAFNWSPVGSIVGGVWSGAATVSLSTNGWFVLQARTTDKPEQITTLRDRQGVGYKVLQLGQSQTQIYLGSTGTAGLVTAPLRQTASIATRDHPSTGPDEFDQLSYVAEPRDGLGAFVAQMRIFDPLTPIMVIDAAVNGSGPDQLMNDASTNRSWSDLQVSLDRFGNDVSAVAMNWATQGWSQNGATPANTLEALLYGTGDYPNTIDHHLNEALAPGWSFALQPATRHSAPSGHNTTRNEQVAFANANGLTVGPPLHDFHTVSEAGGSGGPHQTPDEGGSRRFGVQAAVAVARALGLDTTTNPHFTGTATLGGGGTTITIPVTLPNGGTLYSPAPAALTSFQVAGSFDGFSAAIVGSAVVLTKDSGTWATGVSVAYSPNGPIYSTGTYDAAAERAYVDGCLYERIAGYDVTGLGLLISGTMAGGYWIPHFETSVT